jgi:hypothetical protein
MASTLPAIAADFVRDWRHDRRIILGTSVCLLEVLSLLQRKHDLHLCANGEAVVEWQGCHADRHSGVMAGVFAVELEDEV